MRRLAAIMFTDMVGYSAITQKDEALALSLLEEHRELLRPFFSKHDGREIETAGDAFFVEFNSAVEAVLCAVEMQSSLHERNKTESADRQIRIRIGIHIGDVVYSENNLHGDGVNIAARLEPLAVPGGICVSQDVARQIRNKIPYPVVTVGREKLKNITMPMDVFYIDLPWQPAVQKRRSSFVKKHLARFVLIFLVAAAALFIVGKTVLVNDAVFSKHRVAVLPLHNISNNPADEYFADGMTEELISSLSKIGGLNVIARTSSMKYKTGEKDISEIGKELMVGSILEGSVRKVENKARITIQLIDVATQQPVWSKDFDRELRDIFSVQSEIAQSVANELEVRLVSSEKDQLAKTATTNMAAFEEYLVGKHFLNKRTPDGVQASVTHFEKAIAADSAFALPYANLAYAFTLMAAAGYGNLPKAEAETKAKASVMSALKIDPTLPEAYAALGYIRFRIDWNWNDAEKQFKKAIELSPGYSTAYEWYGLFLAIHVRLDESLTAFQKAYQLDPLSPSVNNGLARIYHFRNEFSLALKQIDRTIALDPNYAEAHFTKGMIYFKMREYDQAIAELTQAATLSGRRPVILGVLGAAYAKAGKATEAEKLLQELRSPPMTSDKEYASQFTSAALGKKEQALDVLEKLLTQRYGLLVFLKVDKELYSMNTDPRYQKILQRMNL